MSDDFVRNKLVQFGLDDSLSQIFAEHNIDETVWPFIKDFLKDMIPQVGLRIKFLQHYNLEAEVCPSVENSDTSETFLNTSFDSLSNSTASASTVSVLSIEKGVIIEEISEETEQENDIGEEDALKKLLDSTPKGKYILGYYSLKKRFDDDCRNKLTEIIINDALGQNADKRLNRNDFINLATQIVKTFPGESKEIYFRLVMKRTASGKWTRDGQGKLFSRYYNLRKSLKRVGLISIEQEEDILPNEHGDVDDSAESLRWLRNNIEPWSQVELLWTKSFRTRQNELKDTPIHGYYANYRVLRENRGFTLLENDFQSLFPEHNMNFYGNWPEFSHQIIEKANTAKDKNVLNYLSVYNKATDEDVKGFVCLKMLPLLLRAQTVSKNYKPSKEEVQQAFIFHIKRIEDLHNSLEERKKKLLHLGLTFQPTPIVVGSSEDDIGECFVSVDGILYNVCTPLKAVELCFKVIHALNAQYPPEAEHIWLCVQKGIFKINTKYDRMYTSVSQFLKDSGLLKD